MDVKIGLEVHVQLNKLKTKLFCSCPLNYYESEPNTHVCPVCLGLPGAMPVLNKEAVKAAIKVALALHEYNHLLFLRERITSIPICQKDFKSVSMTNRLQWEVM